MERREYESPVFEVYGTLNELTEVGNTDPNTDGIFYNNPPPHAGTNVPPGQV